MGGLAYTMSPPKDSLSLQWRHNKRENVSNHQHHDCLLNIKAPRLWPLCARNSPGPVNSPHNGAVARKIFPFDDVIMSYWHDRCHIHHADIYHIPPIPCIYVCTNIALNIAMGNHEILCKTCMQPGWVSMRYNFRFSNWSIIYHQCAETGIFRLKI